MSVVLSAASGPDVRPRREFLSVGNSSSSSSRRPAMATGEAAKRKPRAASERFAALGDDISGGARDNQLSAVAKKERDDSNSSSTTLLVDDDEAEEKEQATAEALDDDDDDDNNNCVEEEQDAAPASDDDVDAESDDTAAPAPPPPMSNRVGGRFSESAVPEKLDPAFVVPVQPHDFTTTRSSLVSFEPAAKAGDGGDGGSFAVLGVQRSRRIGGANFVDFSARDSCVSDADSAFQFLGGGMDDGGESSASLATPRSPSAAHALPPRANPYDGISIDVNNHSINNQGVVLYHVDIKGPEGLLSTYTIRRRYRAFKELHQKLQALIAEYAASQSKADAIPDAFSADNVPDSPHTQARNHERLQQIAEHSVLSASFAFPALPSGGVWSYLKRHDVRLVEQRKKRFEEILRIAIRHPATKNSAMLDSFLSVAPSLISQRGSSYVSLQDYSVPVFDRQRESIERKQLKLRLIEGRRQRTSSEASSSQS